LARTADLIGDKWTLMILRDAFYGVKSFSAFQLRLGVAKTVLSDRFKRLVEGGILERTGGSGEAAHPVYLLTPAGRELFPLIVAMVQWGDKWVFGAGQEPAELIEVASGAPVSRVDVRGRGGRSLSPREVIMRPSPEKPI